MNRADPFDLPEWTYASGAPGATARIRADVDDFVVSEELGFAFTGDGEHEYLYVEKVDLTTDEAARRLAKRAALLPRDVSFSGLKDRRARTRQWFSLHRPAESTLDWSTAGIDGLRVLDSIRHRRKLRRGAHTANTFRIVLRELVDPDDSVPDKLERLARDGVPNYFGEQRFGREGRNIALALRIFAGDRLPRQQRSMSLSAARSLIFNDLLSRRVASGDWNRLLIGDIANLGGSRSVFAVDAVDAQLERRCRDFDLHPTGPLWGRGASSAAGRVADLELDAASSYPALRDGLERETRESRRALRMRVDNLDWARGDDSLTIEFRLPVGCFATAVLRELVRTAE